jgi:hypothetical protein
VLLTSFCSNIASDAELREAASTTSTLKLLVNADLSSGFVQVNAGSMDDTVSVTSSVGMTQAPASFNPEPPVSAASSSMSASVEPTPAPQKQDEPSIASPHPESPEPAAAAAANTNNNSDSASSPAASGEAPPSHAELHTLLQALLRDPAVVEALPTAAAVGLASLKEGDALSTVVDTILASSDVLAAHPSVLRMRPHLGPVLAALEPRLQPFLHMMRSFDANLVSALLPLALSKLAAGNLAFALGGAPWGLHCGTESPQAQACCQNRSSSSCEAGAAPSAAAPSTAPTSNQAVHRQFICDGCGTGPIVGDRFHCTVCVDFDLCEKCEAVPGLHSPAHPLLKIRAPLDSEAYQREQVHIGITCDGCGKAPIEGVRFKCAACPDYDLCGACEAKQEHPVTHPLIKMRVPAGVHRGAWSGVGGGWRRRGPCGMRGGVLAGMRCPWMNRQAESASSTSSACSGASAPACGVSQPAAAAPVDAALASKDAEQAALEVRCGESFERRWELVNTGSGSWPQGAMVMFVRGDHELLGGAVEEFPLNSLPEPGQRTQACALLRAPMKPGRYSAYFRVATSAREAFGPQIDHLHTDKLQKNNKNKKTAIHS